MNIVSTLNYVHGWPRLILKKTFGLILSLFVQVKCFVIRNVFLDVHMIFFFFFIKSYGHLNFKFICSSKIFFLDLLFL
jgi:hypothetical protein